MYLIIVNDDDASLYVHSCNTIRAFNGFPTASMNEYNLSSQNHSVFFFLLFFCFCLIRDLYELDVPTTY